MAHSSICRTFLGSDYWWVTNHPSVIISVLNEGFLEAHADIFKFLVSFKQQHKDRPSNCITKKVQCSTHFCLLRETMNQNQDKLIIWYATTTFIYIIYLDSILLGRSVGRESWWGKRTAQRMITMLPQMILIKSEFTGKKTRHVEWSPC